MSASVQYLSVATRGPLILLRVPWPLPMRWKDLLRALTPVMHDHEGRQKDIQSIDGIVDANREPGQSPEDDELAAKAERAFAGDKTLFSKFWLYTWREESNGFVLSREPS